ncbi:MAG: TraB/GumN family protein [Nanoarchaeota archaeon]|nr:TraB/GumN family protein [Nanoarchaeota archaeon]
MKYKNLMLIGTSHISKDSIKEVRDAIENNNPAIVAVELDANRYWSMRKQSKSKTSIRDIFHIGVVGFLFAILGRWAQKKLGKLVGVMPGSEMMTAIKSAQKAKSQIKLIDQDITITLRRLSKSITWREKGRFILDILKSIVFRKSEMKRLGIEDLDLSKVPPKKLIKKLISEFRKSYPNAYRVLVTERNEVMAIRLAKLMDDNSEKLIVAVVGAGHEEEMISLIRKFQSKKKIIYSFTVST